MTPPVTRMGTDKGALEEGADYGKEILHGHLL